MSPRTGTAVSLVGPPVAETHTLSRQQARSWEAHQLDPSGRHNVSAAIRIAGPLDLAGLVRDLEELAERHDLLRTTFPVRDGTPCQSVRASAPQELQLIDARGCVDEA